MSQPPGTTTRVSTLAAASLAAALCLSAPSSGRSLAAAERHAPAPAARAAEGRIEGIVTVSSALVSRKPRFRFYDDAGAPPPPPPANELANVVIYLEPNASSPQPAPVRASLEQRDERFQPRVLVVPVHSTIDFPNRDDVYHNVFSLSGVRSFDLGRYGRNASKSVRIDRPGVVRVFCHIHADMSAAIVVVDGPAYAIPDSAGHYALGALPPGDYTLVGWHERSEPVRRTVHIAAGETTRLDLRIPIADAPVRAR
jgi:plastocyanin